MGNSHDRATFKALVKRLRHELLLPLEEQRPSDANPKLLTGEFFGVLALVVAYSAATGMTGMDDARVFLVIAWILSVVGLITSRSIWGKPFRYKLWTGCVLAVSLAVGLYYFDHWTVGHFVSVKPDQNFTLSDDLGVVENTLYVSNRAEDPTYSVWLKVSIATRGVSSETVEVELDDPSIPAKPNPLNDQLAIADARWFPGFDSHGVEAVYVWFPSIPPHATYHLTIKGSALIKSVARAKIVAFSLIPGISFSKDNGSGFKMPPIPESMSFRRFGFQVVERKKTDSEIKSPAVAQTEAPKAHEPASAFRILSSDKKRDMARQLPEGPAHFVLIVRPGPLTRIDVKDRAERDAFAEDFYRVFSAAKWTVFRSCDDTTDHQGLFVFRAESSSLAPDSDRDLFAVKRVLGNSQIPFEGVDLSRQEEDLRHNRLCASERWPPNLPDEQSRKLMDDLEKAPRIYVGRNPSMLPR